MAAISSGGGSSFESWITETRYCIVDHLLWFGGAPRERPLTPATNTSAPIRHRLADFFPGLSARAPGHRHPGDLAVPAIPLVSVRVWPAFRRGHIAPRWTTRPRSQTVLTSPEQPSGDRCPECGSEHFFLCPVRSERGDS